MRIVQLLEGIHAAVPHDLGTLLPGHTGAVTLLSDGKWHILVDTGARGTFPRVQEALTGEGLSPDDIGLVILTHFHLDHSYNVGCFPKAKLLAWNHDWREGETLRIADLNALPVMAGVGILRTPGHAPEHLSILARRPDGFITVIAGDAVNEEYLRTGKIHAFAYDEAVYRKSADLILSLANRVIPGHGAPFDVNR